MRQAYNSTIGLKRKVCKTCHKKEYIFSHGECKSCAKISSTKKRFENSDEEEVENLSGLIEDLDWAVSRYIRIKSSDEKGLFQCFTCGKVGHFSMGHCSHFINRSHLATRWLEENLTASCPQCNDTHNANQKPYTDALEKHHKGITEYLLEQSRIVTKPTRTELKELLAIYRGKLRLVEQKLKK